MIKNKVLVAIPSGDLVQARLIPCLLGIFANRPEDTEVFYANKISSRITENRNGLVKIAQERGMTHILFVDSDMTFPENSLKILLNHDKDIVGATACHRQEGPNKAIGVPVDTTNQSQERMVKMQIMGLPFTLIKMHVFDKLNKPYFAEPFDEQGEVVPEDNFFYINAGRAGFDIWCDNELSMQIGHIGLKEYRISKVPALKLVEDIPNVA